MFFFTLHLMQLFSKTLKHMWICCSIKPMTIKSEFIMENENENYKRNEVDVFKGSALRACEGVKFKQIQRFKITNLHIGGNPDGWQGDYIDIGFTNGTRFCDIELTDTNFSKFNSSTKLATSDKINCVGVTHFLRSHED